MSIRVTAVTLIALTALATSGCGGSSDSPDKDKAGASTVSAKPATGSAVNGTGYAYTAPKGWRPPTQKIPGFDPDSLVGDSGDHDGFTDNINVLLQDPAPVTSTDTLEKASKQQLEGIHASDVTIKDRQTVDGETAVHLTSTLSQNGVDYHTDQFAMIHDKVVYVVTFSRSATVTAAAEESLAQSVMATWKWAS